MYLNKYTPMITNTPDMIEKISCPHSANEPAFENSKNAPEKSISEAITKKLIIAIAKRGE